MQLLPQPGQVGVVGLHAKQRLRPSQEAVVVADEIQHHEVLLAFMQARPRLIAAAGRGFEIPVGRSIITVSMLGRSTPSLKRSTENGTCIPPYR